MAEEKYLNFVELCKKAYPQWQNKNNRFWSWKEKLCKLEHQPPWQKTSLLYQLKKKKKQIENESSNKLQSNVNDLTCSKQTDEVITANGKKIRYTLIPIIPLPNLHGNLSKFLTKTRFWESAWAGLSIDCSQLRFLDISKPKIPSKNTWKMFIRCLKIYLSLCYFSPL